MSRPPEVEQAMSYRNGPLSCVLTMSDGSKRYGHEILAAEVERLEAECLEAKCYMVQHARERGREMQRAEAAEARAKELELKLVRQDEVAREAYEAAVWKYGQERMELEAQVKELEALEAKRAQFDSDHCMDVLVPHDKYEQMERAETRLRELQAGDYEKLEAQNARLRTALEDYQSRLVPNLRAELTTTRSLLDEMVEWTEKDISTRSPAYWVAGRKALNGGEASE